MANLIYWENASSVELCPGTADSDTDMKDMDNNEGILTASVENTEAYQYIMFRLKCKLDSASTSGYWNLYLIRSLDGTNFEDGSVSSRVVTTPARPPDLIIPVRDVNTQQDVIMPPMLAPPEDFKVLLVNKTGQSCSNTDNENELHYLFFGDEVQ